MDCILCRQPIPDEPGKRLGNSATPLKEGRCCDKCDEEWVVPVRLIMGGHTPDYAKAVGKLSHMRPPEYNQQTNKPEIENLKT